MGRLSLNTFTQLGFLLTGFFAGYHALNFKMLVEDNMYQSAFASMFNGFFCVLLLIFLIKISVSNHLSNAVSDARAAALVRRMIARRTRILSISTFTIIASWLQLPVKKLSGFSEFFESVDDGLLWLLLAGSLMHGLTIMLLDSHRVHEAEKATKTVFLETETILMLITSLSAIWLCFEHSG